MPLARQRSIRAGAVVVAVFVAAGILRLPLILVLAVALPVSFALAWLSMRKARGVMKHDDGALLSVFLHFIAISLFTVGGVISALPEMHRFAVDLEHWMTDRQFAEMFAIAQITPGPNMMIVTLIGYHAAGVLGGVVATLCVSLPPAVLACRRRARLRARPRRRLADGVPRRADAGGGRAVLGHLPDHRLCRQRVLAGLGADGGPRPP